MRPWSSLSSWRSGRVTAKGKYQRLCLVFNKVFLTFPEKITFPHFDSDFRVPGAGRVRFAQPQTSRVCRLIEKKCFRSIFYEIPSSIVKCGLGCFKWSLALRWKSLIKETKRETAGAYILLQLEGCTLMMMGFPRIELLRLSRQFASKLILFTLSLAEFPGKLSRTSELLRLRIISLREKIKWHKLNF